jgi:hypothetical protein
VKKPRKKPSKKSVEAVLDEYNHLCAICGGPRPQIHHIDEDPSSNDPLNLLPLCPNHHLVDVHNPTKKLDHLKLWFFRKHRDPMILSPQFDPVFRRLRFLLKPFDSLNDQAFGQSLHDLTRFIERLEMGAYYAKVYYELIQWQQPPPYTEAERERVLAEHSARYRAQIDAVREKLIELAVEQLRYQKWPLLAEVGSAQA